MSQYGGSAAALTVHSKVVNLLCADAPILSF